MRIPDGQLRTVLDPPSTEWRSRPRLRDAAVLAPLFEQAGADHVLYTRRRDDLKSHPGEISFPGGGREGGEHALACALRECEEEIGLAPAAVDVLGRLPERPSIGGFYVHVFVGRLAAVDDLRIDPGEVAKLMSIPVAELMREERWEWRSVTRGHVRRQIPFFAHEGEMLWGLTGVLTQDLLARLGRSPA
ncbi:MAG: CoA pyrophosphatase [Planctomycetota bacterium]